MASAIGFRRMTFGGRTGKPRPFVHLDRAFSAVIDYARWGRGGGWGVPRVAAAKHWTLAWRRTKDGISFPGRLEAMYIRARCGGDKVWRAECFIYQ
jgi:hypothetical protein